MNKTHFHTILLYYEALHSNANAMVVSYSPGTWKFHGQSIEMIFIQRQGKDHIPFPDYEKGFMSGRGVHGLCCHKVGMVESNGNIQHIMKKCDMKYALHSSVLLQ